MNFLWDSHSRLSIFAGSGIVFPILGEAHL
jgi:hypothetical protein